MKKAQSEFPILKDKKLVYLDSGSTSLKPGSVIQAVRDYYTQYSANVHRGLYQIAERATEQYEGVRSLVADYIHASDRSEIIFTRGTTESINLVARCMPLSGNQVVTTVLEHHSNFVPWQQLAHSKGYEYKVAQPDDSGSVQRSLGLLVNEQTSIVALQHASNVLGSVQPIKQIIKDIRSINPKALIVVDAAQSVAHMKLDVQEIDCDFLAFSGHKMYGPTGIGVLWGRKQHLERTSPWQYGGDMVREVTVQTSTFHEAPQKFEAGTQNIAGVIGLGAAIRFVQSLDLEKARKHEIELANQFVAGVKSTFGGACKVYSSSEETGGIGIVSLSLRDCHAHDIAAILAEDSIAIRAGHHCAQPLHSYLGETATARLCFSIYNTSEQVEQSVASLKRAYKLLT